MNIVLLGHDDIASLFAMSCIVAARPEHAYCVFLSGALFTAATAPPGLAALAAVDRALCENLACRRRGAACGRRRTGAARSQHSRRSVAPVGGGARPHRVDTLPPHTSRAGHRDPAPRRPEPALRRPAELPGRHGNLLGAPGRSGSAGLHAAPDRRRGHRHRACHRLLPPGPRIATRPTCATCSRCTRQGSNSSVQRDRCARRRGPVTAQPQAPATGRYFSTPDAAALARFEAAGLRLVDGREDVWLAEQVRVL